MAKVRSRDGRMVRPMQVPFSKEEWEALEGYSQRERWPKGEVMRMGLRKFLGLKDEGDHGRDDAIY